MTSSANIILRSRETKNKPYKIDPDIKEIPGNEVCVLYLGGSGTTTQHDANGNAKKIEQQVLDVIFPDVPVYSIVYNFNDVNNASQKARTKHIHTGDNKRFSTHKYIYLTKKNIDYKLKKDIFPIFTNNGKLKPFKDINLKHLTIYIDDETNDNHEIIIEKFIKKLFIFLKESKYTTQEQESILSQILKSFSFNTHYDTKYIDDIFNKTLLPRISENDKRLPLTTAMQRIRKINIVSHCHGGYISQKLEEMLQQKMHELGYSVKETNQILSQLLIVAHAPAHKPKRSKTHFLGFMSTFDYFTFSTENYIKQYINIHKRQDIKHISTNDIPEMEHQWLPNGPIFLGGAAGNIFLIARGFNFWKHSDVFGPHPNEHNNTSYVKLPNQNQQGFILNLIARNVLRNGILNSLSQKDKFIPLPDNADLIKWDDDDSKLIRPFTDMDNDGKKFINHIYKSATDYIKSLHPQKTNHIDYDR